MPLNKIEITESLFSHINNDPFLTGSYRLESQRFKNTVGYLIQYIDSLKNEGTYIPDDVLRLVTACSLMLEKIKEIDEINKKNVQETDLVPLAEDWFNAISTQLQTPEDYLLFPGGWASSAGSHAIIYQFQKNEQGDLIFTINNSGSGLRYHAKRSIAEKELYCPVLQYRIPQWRINDKKNFVPILQALISARVLTLHAEYDAYKLYMEVFSKFSFLNATIQPPPGEDKEYLYTGGQLSGTCSQRSIHQMLKSNFGSLDEYRQFIFQFKAHSLRDYMKKLRKKRGIAKPQYQPAVIKAICHQLRLLNNDKHGHKGEPLFPEEYQRQYTHEYEGYLAELSKALSPPEKRIKPNTQANVQTFHQIKFAKEQIPDCSKNSKIEPPVFNDNIRLPRGGKNLLQEMEQFLVELNALEKNGGKQACFDTLERFFLSLPVRVNKTEHRHEEHNVYKLLNFDYKNASSKDFDKLMASMSGQVEENQLEKHAGYYDFFDRRNFNTKVPEFFKLIGKLQKIYFKLGNELLGNNITLPRMLLSKTAVFFACYKLLDIIDYDSSLKQELKKLPLALLVLNEYASQLATHNPAYDELLVQLNEHYDNRRIRDEILSSRQFRIDLTWPLISRYNNIINKFLDLKFKLNNAFNEKYKNESNEKLRHIIRNNCQALYYYFKHVKPDDIEFDELHRAFKDQLEIDSALSVGIQTLHGSAEKFDETPSFRLIPWPHLNSFYFPSPIVEAFRSYGKDLYGFWLGSPLLNSQYKLPDGSVKDCLSCFVNQKSSSNPMGDKLLGMPPSNKVQLNQWRKAQVDTITVGPLELEERELYHLRKQPAIQIILTLEYFLKHPEKLSRHEMQVYCDANIFQPKLLFNLLQYSSEKVEKNFWSLLQRFVDKGISVSEKKGRLSPQSLFYVRINQMIIQYAYTMYPDKYRDTLSTFKVKLNQWISEPQNQEQLAHLHYYRFLTLSASLKFNEIPASVEDRLQLMHSYFLINVSSLPSGCDEPDEAYRLEAQKRAMMKAVIKIPHLLPIEGVLLQLEQMGLIPSAEQRLSRVHIEFPIIRLTDLQANVYVVDIQQGLVLRNNMSLVHTPLFIRHHPVLQHYEIMQVQKCWRTANNEQYIIDLPSNKLRFTKWNDEGYRIEQLLDGTWFELIPSTAEQGKYLNLTVSHMECFPEELQERLNFTWLRSDARKIIITDSKNQVLYQANKNSYHGILWRIKDKQQDLHIRHSKIESLLADMETHPFVLVFQRLDQSLKIRLPRYGLEFFQPVNQDRLYLTTDSKNYKLDSTQSLAEQGIAALHFDNKSRCLLPVIRYIATRRRDPENEYYLYEADTENKIAFDIVKYDPEKEGNFNGILSWQYTGSRKSMFLKMKNGEPYPETPAEALYLCYVYLANHKEKKALDMLEACDKLLGGLTGSYEELEYLCWICKFLPYELDEPGVGKDASISTPPVVACQLKAISLLSEYSKLGRDIQIPELSADANTADVYVQNCEIRTNKQFYESDINEAIYQLYGLYQLMRRDMPVDFILSESDSRSLLNFYHDRLPDSDGNAPKAIGSLGYDWLRLNFINLKRELHHIQHKESQNIKLSDFEQKRKAMILRLLADHEGVYQTRSILERVYLDLDHTYLCSILSTLAKNSWEMVYGNELAINVSSVQGLYRDAINHLSPNMEPELFEKNFAVYVNLAMSGYDDYRKILEQFTIAVLKASRHNFLNPKAAVLNELCNVIYRVICAKNNNYSLVRNTNKFSSYDKFHQWLSQFKPDPIVVYQLKNTAVNLLADTQAVQQSIPDQRPNVKPEVLSSVRQEIEGLDLYEDKDLSHINRADSSSSTSSSMTEEGSDVEAVNLMAVKEILSHRDSWQRWEEQFYTGRAMAASSQSEQEISDEDAGNNKLLALKTLQKLACQVFQSRESLSMLGEHTGDRLDILASKKEYMQYQLLALANQGPSAEDSKQRWDIDIAAEKRKPLDVNALLALFFQNDMVRYQEVTGLDSECVKELHGQIARFLKYELLIQQLKRINKDIEKLSQHTFEDIPKASLFKLVQKLFAPDLISIFDEPALSVFQYYEDKLLRPHQKKALEHLLEQDDRGHYKEVVEKIVMGGGKSKVLLPNIAFHKANGDNLVIVEVPKALLRTNYIDLKATSNNLFGQSAFIFEFSRDSDCSSTALQALFKRFSDVMVNKNYIVTTGESMQSLELKYLELLNKRPEKLKEVLEWKKRVYWAELLILMIKNRGDCLIDEVHQGLLLKNRLNYTVGETKVLSRFVRDNVLQLYKFFKEVPLENIDGLKEQGLTMASLLQFYKPLKTKAQYEKACQLLASALVTNPKSPLLEGLKQIGKSLKDEDKEALKQYFFDQAETVPPFIDELPEDFKDLIALYKEEVNHLLAFTLRRNANEHYGPSQNSDKNPAHQAVAIPYRANNTPNEQSSFGNEIETINYTIQSMLINGLPEPLLKHYLTFLLQQARMEAKWQQKESINETPSGSFFHLMSNNMQLTELDIDNPGQIRALHERMANQDTIIFEVLKNNVLRHIYINNSVLSSNALGHVDMMNTFQAFSGTPWNASTYHQRLDYKRELALGTDEYIISCLVNKKTPVRAADFSKPECLVNSLLSQYGAQDELRNIIDISAAFKGISNEKVARQIAAFIEDNAGQFNHPKPIKFVLFFNEADKLSALPVEKKGLSSNIIIFGSSSEEIITQRLSCTPEERFTFYDQAHTLGTDIVQSEKAKGIVLSDQSTMISNFLQGVLRNREVLDGQQSVDVYLPQEIAENQSIQALCKEMQTQENAQLRQDNYLSAQYKLSNLVRRDLLNRILSCQEGADKKAELFKIYRSHFIEEQQESLYNRFGGLVSMENTELLLTRSQQRLLNSWEVLLNKSGMVIVAEEKENLSNQMSNIIKRVMENGECDEMQLSQGKTEAIEIELLTEVEKMEERIVRSIDSGLLISTEYSIARPDFLTLKEICQSASPSYIPDFDDNIKASCNFYKIYRGQTNYLDLTMMPVHALYFEMNGNELHCTILAPEEFEIYAHECSYGKRWISTTDHSLLAGNMPEGIRNKLQYKKIIEQIRFFNGDLSLLVQRDEPLTWLVEQLEEKLEFFENHLSLTRESQAIHLEELRMGMAEQYKMLNFISRQPQRDFRNFDWQRHFPKASDVDVIDIKNVASAFYELTGSWWNNEITAAVLAEKYHLSTTSLGFLAQYENMLKNNDVLLDLKRLIITFNQASPESQDYQEILTLFISILENGKAELSKHDLSVLSSGVSEVKLSASSSSSSSSRILDSIDLENQWSNDHFVNLMHQSSDPWLAQDAATIITKLFTGKIILDEEQASKLLLISQGNPELAFCLLRNPGLEPSQEHIEPLLKSVAKTALERLAFEILTICQMDEQRGNTIIRAIATSYPPGLLTEFAARILLQPEAYNLHRMDVDTLDLFIIKCQNIPLLEVLLKHPQFENISAITLADLCQRDDLSETCKEIILQHPQLTSPQLINFIAHSQPQRELRNQIRQKEQCDEELLVALMAKAEDSGELIDCLTHERLSNTENKLQNQSLEAVNQAVSSLLDTIHTTEELDNLLHIVGPARLQEVIFRRIVLHPASDSSIIFRLAGYDFNNMPEMKLHIDSFKHSQGLKTQLEQLRQIADNLESQYRPAAVAARELYHELLQATENLLRKDQCIDSNKIRQFQNSCVEAFNKNNGARMRTLQQHPEAWYRIHPVLRGILAAISIITIAIPAVLVKILSEKGFRHTFFATPKSEAASKIEEIQEQIDNIQPGDIKKHR